MLDIDITHPRLRFCARLADRGVSAIFGPSGAGKSTLLRVISGLERAARGHVRFGDQNWQEGQRCAAPETRRIGYVFQEPRLFDHLTVLGNLQFAARHAAFAPQSVLPQTPMEALEAMGIADLAQRRPNRLSGGEAARVALARALMSAPQLLLLDEPLAALDQPRREAILPLIETLAATLPVVYVSHALDEITRLARDIYVLDRGALQAHGPLSQVLTDPKAAPFLGPRGMGAVIGAVILAHHDDGVSELAISGGRLIVPRLAGEIGRRIVLRIPAADVIVARAPVEVISALNILPVQVIRMDAVAGGVLVAMACGADTISARLTQRSASALDLRAGETVFAIVKSVAIGAA